jgi:hypothetical protein
MKTILLFIFLMLLNWGLFSQNSNTDNRQLWLLTAKVSVNSTYKRDTIHSFTIENMKTETKFHQSSTTNVSSTISAVIENQAENPLKEFSYDSDAGESVNMSVTGKGMHISTTKGSETINGKLISAEERNDHVSGSALPKASIQFSYSDDYKMASIGVNIIARGTSDARTYFDEWKDYGGPIEDYGISCSDGCSMPDDKNCKISKTGKGYSASWSSSENKKSSSSNGMEYHTYETSIEFTIVPYKESEKPVVTLDGCSKIGVEGMGSVAAKAKPDGGTYKFWVEPSDMMTVSANGAEATLTGKTPGHGVLLVEYTTPDGKAAQTSMEAACVSIESYNGGQPIPVIGLFDIDGKKKNGILTVPVKALPVDAAELVKFEPTDPGVLSAVGVGSEVTLQGLKTGTTTLQAKTKCGDNTGPAVEVEVANCDDETIATLERMMKAAKDGQKEAYQAIEQIVGTKEFEEMENKIAESTGNLAVKTAGLIVGTLSGGKGVDAGVKTAGELFGRASNVIDILKGDNIDAHISNFSQLIVELAGGPIQQTIAGGIETFQAANEFGKDLGKMIGASRQLESAMKEAEHWNKVVENMVARQKFCRKSSQAPQAKQGPTTKPGTKPTEPKPTEPTAKTQTPPVQEPTTPEQPQPTEPTTTDESTDDGTEISPPPPTSKPRQIGLPYSPGECGCNQNDSLNVSRKGFSTLQTGMENLGECVETFSKGPLTNYIQTLQDWQTVLNTLQEATNAKPAEFKLVSEQSIPKMESLLKQTKDFDNEGKKFVDAFSNCTKSMEAGVGLMQSAEQITIDSIKTR